MGGVVSLGNGPYGLRMPDNHDLADLRAVLAKSPPASTPEGKKKLAEEAIAQILDAVERGVCALGNWELKCLTGAIAAVEAGSYDMGRSKARKALWPEENRRESEVARFWVRQDMIDLAGLRRALASLQATAAR